LKHEGYGLVNIIVALADPVLNRGNPLLILPGELAQRVRIAGFYRRSRFSPHNALYSETKHFFIFIPLLFNGLKYYTPAPAAWQDFNLFSLFPRLGMVVIVELTGCTTARPHDRE
jgi:hypothetical protein